MASLFSYKKPPPKNRDPRTLRKNILRVYKEAAAIEIAYGRTWYREAHKIAYKEARQHSVSIKCAAHVLAALSPNNPWRRNILDARILLQESVTRKGTGHKFCTYKRNVEKARAIVAGFLSEKSYIGHRQVLGEEKKTETGNQKKPWNEILSGPKVTAFAENIEFPTKPRRVTVDVHAFSIANNYRWTTKTLPKFGRKEYDVIAKAYENAARELELLPQELQAITWLVWKRKHRV